MTNTKKTHGLLHGIHPAWYCSVILFLVSYISIDVVKHPADFDLGVCSSLSVDALNMRQGKLTREDAKTLLDKWNAREDKYCSSILGHLPTKRRWAGAEKEDPWNHMKWIGKPARCRVKGQLIERLDDENNFRRGFALKYGGDVEDKIHILPWLLGNKVDLNLRERRVYLDLGANCFNTSIQWFMRMYPCDFTEVHAFEIDPQLLKLPEVPYEEYNNTAATWDSKVVNETPGIPLWMLERMQFYNQLVSDADNRTANAINVTRFIKEELHLTPADTVVVKMDIEGSEWPILKRWMDDPEMADIVDELFVEIHYSHPSMQGFGWDQFVNHSREQATHLLAGLRSRGFFVHAWP